MIKENEITIRWERFENERWSEYASFLLLLPSLHQMNHPLLLAEDTALALYGSCVFQQLKALNSTIRLDYELTEKMLRSNGLLRKEFISSKLFTFERYLVRLTGSHDVQWSYLVFESKSVFCEGHQLLLPPLMFGQNSLYQEVGEYAEIRHENNSYVVISRDSTRFTKDYVLKQGFPNWYMLLQKYEDELI